MNNDYAESFVSEGTTLHDGASSHSGESEATLDVEDQERQARHQRAMDRLPRVGLDGSQFPNQPSWIQADLIDLLEFKETTPQLRTIERWLRNIGESDGAPWIGNTVTEADVQDFAKGIEGEDPIVSLILHSHGLPLLELDEGVKSFLRSRFVLWSLQASGEDHSGFDAFSEQHLWSMGRAVGEVSEDVWNLVKAVQSSNGQLDASAEMPDRGWRALERHEFLGGEQGLAITAMTQMCTLLGDYPKSVEQTQSERYKSKALSFWKDLTEMEYFRTNAKEDLTNKLCDEMEHLRPYQGKGEDYPRKDKLAGAKRFFSVVHHGWKGQAWLSAKHKSVEQMQALTAYRNPMYV